MYLTAAVLGRDGRNIEIKPIGKEYIERILSLQADFTDKATFFPITEEELSESIERDFLLGAFSEGELYAFAMLVGNRDCERSLAYRLGMSPREVASFDGVVVHPTLRGSGLQRAFLGLFEKAAREVGASAIAATVAQINVYSKRNFEAEGYTSLGETDIYGGRRILMIKRL